MDIKTSKIELVKIILNIENDDFMQRITDYIKDEKADFWNELTSKEQVEIKKGIGQLERSVRIPFENVLERIS